MTYFNEYYIVPTRGPRTPSPQYKLVYRNCGKALILFRYYRNKNNCNWDVTSAEHVVIVIIRGLMIISRFRDLQHLLFLLDLN